MCYKADTRIRPSNTTKTRLSKLGNTRARANTWETRVTPGTPQVSCQITKTKTRITKSKRESLNQNNDFAKTRNGQNTDTSPRHRMHHNHIENRLENTGVLHSSPLKLNFVLKIRLSRRHGKSRKSIKSNQQQSVVTLQPVAVYTTMRHTGWLASTIRADMASALHPIPSPVVTLHPVAVYTTMRHTGVVSINYPIRHTGVVGINSPCRYDRSLNSISSPVPLWSVPCTPQAARRAENGRCPAHHIVTRANVVGALHFHINIKQENSSRMTN